MTTTTFSFNLDNLSLNNLCNELKGDLVTQVYDEISGKLLFEEVIKNMYLIATERSFYITDKEKQGEFSISLGISPSVSEDNNKFSIIGIINEEDPIIYETINRCSFVHNNLLGIFILGPSTYKRISFCLPFILASSLKEGNWKKLNKWSEDLNNLR